MLTGSSRRWSPGRPVVTANGDAHYRAEFASLTEEERHQMVRDFSGRLRASGRFPNLSELFESGVDPDSPDTRDERFDLGLECLLYGIAARLPTPGPPPPPPDETSASPEEAPAPAGEAPPGPGSQQPPVPPPPVPFRNPSLPVAARRPSRPSREEAPRGAPNAA